MRYQRVHIQALEMLLPPVVVRTAELEAELAPLYRRIGIPNGVIQSLTGVGARRYWAPGRLPSEAAAEVARLLIARHGVPGKGIEALVSTAVCKDYLEPPVASLVAGDVGMSTHCMNFDVGHACLFLASPLASYVSGTSFAVHGGGEKPAFLGAANAKP